MMSAGRQLNLFHGLFFTPREISSINHVLIRNGSNDTGINDIKVKPSIISCKYKVMCQVKLSVRRKGFTSI